MILPRPLLMTVEEALRSLLRLDPELPSRLARHAGAVIEIYIEGLGTRLAVELTEEGFRFHPEPPAPPRVVVRGGPASLLRLARGAPPTACGVSLQGDPALLQALSQALRQADLDWEEAVAHITGDVIAHQLGRGVRELTAFLRRAGDEFERDLSEYLRDETELLAVPHEVRRWMEAVDELVEAEARLEARLRRLEARMADGQR